MQLDSSRGRAESVFGCRNAYFAPPSPSPPGSTSWGRLLVDLADATPFLPPLSGRRLRELPLDMRIDAITARRGDALGRGAISSRVQRKTPRCWVIAGQEVIFEQSHQISREVFVLVLIIIIIIILLIFILRIIIIFLWHMRNGHLPRMRRLFLSWKYYYY